MSAAPTAYAPARVRTEARVLVSDRRLAAALGVSLIVVLGVFAKLPETVLPIGTDTGMFATYARMMLQGGRPYVDFYDIHPPLTHYYWVLVEAVAGPDWSRTCLGAWGTLAPQPCINLLAHGLDLALTFVAAGLTFAIGRRVGLRPWVSAFAALLVVWFANESMISMEGSTPTKLTLVPATLAVYACLRSMPTGRLAWAGLAGAAAALAVLAKQPALVTLAALVVFQVPAAIRGARPERRILVGLGIGTIAVLAPALLYLGLIGSLGGFIDQAWVYNIQRFLIGYWQTPAGLTAPATRIDRVIGQGAGLLFIGSLLGGLAVWLGRHSSQQRLLLLWAVFSLAAIAGFREFAQVVPVLALLAAIGVGGVWDAASRDGLGLGSTLAGRLGVLIVFGAIFLLTSSFQLVELRRAMYERGPSAAGPADPERIAAWLRDSAPSGPIFAWGNAGQIYALSGRQPATRFVIAEFTNSTTPRPMLSRQQLMDDLQRSPPAVIVIDPHGNEAGLELSGFPALAQLIDRCYTAVAGMPADWHVYERGQSNGCFAS